MGMNTQLSPREVRRALIAIIVLLALIDSALNVLQYGFGHDHVFGLVNLMDLGREGSLPTWYASMQLAAAGVLLSIIAVIRLRRREKHALAWCVLALGFFFMSYDEVAAIHEGWGQIATGVPRRGIFYFRWVVVAIPLCMVLFLFFLGLIGSLSASIRKGTFLSAGVFLGGALGIEMVSGYAVDVLGIRDDLPYSMLNVLENGLELLGIALFIYVLLRHMTEELFAQATPKIGSAPAPAMAHSSLAPE